jgi:hypothetical protein
MLMKKSKIIVRCRQQSLLFKKDSCDCLAVCIFTYNNRLSDPRIYELDFNTLRTFTESCSAFPRVVTLIGLLESEGEGNAVLRKGGSCLLLDTVQHHSRLESTTAAGEKSVSFTDSYIDGST